MIGSQSVCMGLRGLLPRRKTLVSLASLILLAFTSVPVHGDEGGSRATDHVRVIPDTSGAIAEVMLHYLPDMEEELTPLYRDLFSGLPDDIRIQVVCPTEDAVEEFIHEWGPLATSGRRELRLVAVDREITLWSRDRRIARHHARSFRPALQFIPGDFADYEEDKRNEILMAPALTRANVMPRQMADLLHLEGGNIVSNNRHAFIGANVLLDNADLGLGERRLARDLSRIVGLDPVLIRDQEGSVPFCHVDMYLTPLGDHTALVASPMSGLSLLFEDGVSDSCTVVPKWVAAEMDDSSETSQRFDSIASTITDLGYEVVRLPAIIDRSEQWMVTYNNVLIDRRHGCSTIYMPVYGIPVLDQAAEAIYCDLGFDVRTVDVSRIYNLGGAVRCIVNVTRRKPSDARHTIRASRPRGNAEPDDLTDIEDQHLRTTPQDESKLVRLRSSGGGLKQQ